MSNFLTSTSGAVTVDWVVLTAGLVGLGLATMSVVNTGVSDASSDVATHLGANHIRASFGLGTANGSFEDTTGLTAGTNSQGNFYKGAISGWDILDGQNNLALAEDGYRGINAAQGSLMLDMDSGSANVSIAQTYDDMRVGEEFTLNLFAADPAESDPAFSENSVEVYFGGAYVGLIDPTSDTMEEFNFDLVGGSGDGSNQLVLTEVGAADNLGTFVDAITIQ